MRMRSASCSTTPCCSISTSSPVTTASRRARAPMWACATPRNSRPALTPAPYSARAISWQARTNTTPTSSVRAASPPTAPTLLAASTFRPSSNLGFSAQSRFDESTWDIQRTDLGTFARYGPAQLRVNYADVIGEPGLAQDQPREEIVTAGVLAITEDWSLLGNIRYDLQTVADDHRRLGPALSGRLLHARRHLSAVLHRRSGHRARSSASS